MPGHPDPSISKGGGGKSPKYFFRPFGPQLGLKITGGGGGGIGQCIKVSVSGFTDRQFLKVSGLVWTGPELPWNNYSGLDNEIKLRVGTVQPCSVILKQGNSRRISFIDFYLAFYKF